MNHQKTCVHCIRKREVEAQLKGIVLQLFGHATAESMFPAAQNVGELEDPLRETVLA